MQRTESHQKSTDAAIRNLEVQVGQLAKQMAERPTGSFGANTKMNPKEECNSFKLSLLSDQGRGLNRVRPIHLSDLGLGNFSA